MSIDLTLSASEDYVRARRAYELGRARSSLWRALALAVPVGGATWFLSGKSGLIWLPAATLAWVFCYWRGDAFLRGASYGFLGGVVTFLLPMSILRPCCAPGAMPMMGTACCTMPGACLAAGAVVGLGLAAVVPFGKTSWLQTALGMMLGMASVAVVKCATLFAGEALGLLGGLAAGVATASFAKSLLRARAAR